MPPDATIVSVLFDGSRISNLTLVDLAGITDGYVAQASLILVLDFCSYSDGTEELLFDGPALAIHVLGKDVIQALLLDGPASETRIFGTNGTQKVLLPETSSSASRTTNEDCGGIRIDGTAPLLSFLVPLTSSLKWSLQTNTFSEIVFGSTPFT